MTARIEKGNLVISIPLQQPTPSKTGKTLLVASTHGNKQTEAKVNDRPVTVSFNAFIKP